MQTSECLEALYDYLLINNLERMGYKQYKKLIVFSDISTGTSENLLHYMIAYGVARIYIKNGYRHNTRMIEFDRTKLYELSHQDIKKKKSVYLDDIVFNMHQQDLKHTFTREYLSGLLIRITGITSRTAINNKINELILHDYIRILEHSQSRRHNDHNKDVYVLTDRPIGTTRLSNESVLQHIKSNLTDIISFFKSLANNGYRLTMIRITRTTKAYLTIHQIRQSLRKLIESHDLSADTIRIYQKNLYSN